MQTTSFDIAVIGGGAAGLLAAGIAAEHGAKVIVLEKTNGFGNKLLLTGGARCNLSNTNITKDRLLELYGKNGRFLFSGLSVFGVPETLHYFASLGVGVKEEDRGRLITQGDSAHFVLRALRKKLEQHGVYLLTNAAVTNLNAQQGHITACHTAAATITAKRFIVTTGGLSFGETGSSGDGYIWATQLGHTITPTHPALTALISNETWLNQLQGLALKAASVSVWHNNKKIRTHTGDLLFTEHGLSGPVIHDLSGSVNALLNNGPVHITIDCYAALTAEALEQKLQKELANNKMIKTYFETIVTKRLAEIIITRAGVLLEKPCHSINKEERKNIVAHTKALKITIMRTAGYDKAMLTAGGVALNEIDSKTMRSKLIDNLYFAGEILDIDGPSGGYNLQTCWTTGYCAGLAAAITPY